MFATLHTTIKKHIKKHITKHVKKHIAKHITKPLHKAFHKHIKTHCHHHIHKIIHEIRHIHHRLMHMGELLIIGCIGFSSLLYASYNNTYDSLRRDNTEEVAQALVQAMNNGKQIGASSIISVRATQSSVDNKFAPGYCTRGAALISPEFFPYDTGTNNQSQIRSRGGNAVDRCANAAQAGFPVGTTPLEGSFIVYKPGNGISVFGHVAKVIYYNKNTQSLIVREMNFMEKYIMTDRRETTDDTNIKCYIYPKTISDNLTGLHLNILSGSAFNKVAHPITVTTPSSTIQTGSVTSQTTTTITTGTTTTSTPTTTTTTTTTTPVNTQTTPITTTGSATHASAETIPTVQETVPSIEVTTPTTPTEIPSQKVESTTETITPNLSNLSDIAQHFFNQNTLKIKKTISQDIGEKTSVKITMTITDKESGAAYEGLIPFTLQIIANNDNLQGNFGRVQLIKNGIIQSTFTENKKGESSILMTIDDQRIASLPISLN